MRRRPTRRRAGSSGKGQTPSPPAWPPCRQHHPVSLRLVLTCRYGDLPALIQQLISLCAVDAMRSASSEFSSTWEPVVAESGLVDRGHEGSIVHGQAPREGTPEGTSHTLSFCRTSKYSNARCMAQLVRNAQYLELSRLVFSEANIMMSSSLPALSPSTAALVKGCIHPCLNYHALLTLPSSSAILGLIPLDAREVVPWIFHVKNDAIARTRTLAESSPASPHFGPSKSCSIIITQN